MKRRTNVFTTMVCKQDAPVNELNGNLLKQNRSKRTNVKKDKNRKTY